MLKKLNYFLVLLFLVIATESCKKEETKSSATCFCCYRQNPPTFTGPKTETDRLCSDNSAAVDLFEQNCVSQSYQYALYTFDFCH